MAFSKRVGPSAWEADFIQKNPRAYRSGSTPASNQLWIIGLRLYYFSLIAHNFLGSALFLLGIYKLLRLRFSSVARNNLRF